MPDDTYHQHRLALVTRGYTNCIIAIGNISPESWEGISASDMSDTAIASMMEDCATFLDEADRLHPDGRAGLDAIDAFSILGWCFGLARLGLAPDFELSFGWPLGRQLTDLALRFDPIDISLSADRKIVFTP